MEPHVASPDRAGLRPRWSRWTALLERYGRQRRAVTAADAREYRALHRELVAACVAAAAAGGPGCELYRRLEELARPWLSVRVLERTDDELLLDLLARCRQAEQQLGPRPRPRGGR